MTCLLIVLGGGTGALLRYLTTRLAGTLFPGHYPVGTLLVNCIGAFLIGLLINLFGTPRPGGLDTKALLITGFLGGYTTFSTYSLETVQRFLNGDVKTALLNILLNNGLCLLFVLLGMALSKALTPR